MSLPPGVCEERLRRELVETSRALHARGWVANHDGNVSCRLGGGRLLCTPTAVSKGDVTAEMLIVVAPDGSVVQGSRKSFSELQLHRAAYAARPDIGVVLHAHPPTATAFAVAGKPIGHPFMAEPVVTLGPVIPVAAYRRPKSAALDAAVSAALRDADVVLLDRHGVLAVGGSFEQALLRLELVEHLARISHAAQALGGPRPLPSEEIRALAQGGRPKSDPDWSGVSGGAPNARVAAPPRERSDARPDVGRLVSDALHRYR